MLPLTAAFACDTVPLAPRLFLPSHGATDVPLDARILVGLIGWGDPGEFSLDLARSGNTVSATRSEWCYLHEGPYEEHCWIALTPATPLLPSTTYTYRLTTIETSFTTGADPAADPAAPAIDVTEAWDEPAPDECAFSLARRSLISLATEADPLGLSVWQLYESDGAAIVGPVVHTILVNRAGEEPDPAPNKQYLDGDTPRTDCFAAVLENAAGVASAPAFDCWRAAQDTSPPEDTSPPAPADTASTGTSTPPAPRRAGCGSCAFLLFFWRRR